MKDANIKRDSSAALNKYFTQQKQLVRIICYGTRVDGKNNLLGFRGDLGLSQRLTADDADNADSKKTKIDFICVIRVICG